MRNPYIYPPVRQLDGERDADHAPRGERRRLRAVFANLTARPARPRPARAPAGSRTVPE